MVTFFDDSEYGTTMKGILPIIWLETEFHETGGWDNYEQNKQTHK